MKQAKQYVLGSYTAGAYTCMAIYESTDFRVKKDFIEGTFKKDKPVKGLFNGHEIGVFTTKAGVEYLVFTDYTTRLK